LAHAVADRKGGAHRPRGTVEAREEPVARRIDLASAEPLQLATDSIVVRFDQFTPAAVAQRTRAFRRADDVGEQDSRQDPVLVVHVSCTGEELLDHVEQRLLIACPEDVIFTRQLDETSRRDPLSDPSTLLDRYVAIV